MRVFAALAFLVLAACAGGGVSGRDFDITRAQQFTIGTSTKADIRAVMGEPQQVGFAEGSEVWMYSYTDQSLTRGTQLRMLVPMVGLLGGIDQNNITKFAQYRFQGDVLADMRVSGT